jgi:2-oxoisovalerate dehydrogenase E1 component
MATPARGHRCHDHGSAAHRRRGRSGLDASSYRTKDELDLWTATDPITAYFDRLVQGGVVAATRHDELKEWAQQKIKAALEVAIDSSESPRLSLRHDATVMAKITFNDTTVSAEDDNRAAGRAAAAGGLGEEVPQWVGGRKGGERCSGDHLSRRDLRGCRGSRRQGNRLALWGEENRD